jgi:hypothetical protein
VILRRIDGQLHGLEPPARPGGGPVWVPIDVAEGQDETAAAFRWLHTTAERITFGERRPVPQFGLDGPDGPERVEAPTTGLLEGASADERIDAARPYVRLADDLSSGRTELPTGPAVTRTGAEPRRSGISRPSGTANLRPMSWPAVR